MSDKIADLLKEVLSYTDHRVDNYKPFMFDGDSYVYCAGNEHRDRHVITNVHKALEKAGLVDGSLNPRMVEYDIETDGATDLETTHSLSYFGDGFTKQPLSDHTAAYSKSGHKYLVVGFGERSEEEVVAKLEALTKELAAKAAIDREEALRRAEEERLKQQIVRKENTLESKQHHRIEQLAKQIQKEAGRNDEQDEQTVLHYVMEQLNKVIPGVGVYDARFIETDRMDQHGLLNPHREYEIALPSAALKLFNSLESGKQSDWIEQVSRQLDEKLPLTDPYDKCFYGDRPRDFSVRIIGTPAKLAAEISGELQERLSQQGLTGAGQKGDGATRVNQIQPTELHPK